MRVVDWNAIIIIITTTSAIPHSPA